MQKATRNSSKPYRVKKYETFTPMLPDPYMAIELECRRVPLRDVFDYEDMKYRDQIEWFAKNCLVHWNLVDDETGEGIPTTAEGLLSLEHSQALAILGAWYKAVLAPPDPLEMPSKNGALSVVE